MDQPMEWVRRQPIVSVTSFLLTTLLAYIITTAVQNLLLHPLARYPGPRLAALTAYYKAYIEIILQRSWHLQLEKLHKIYGPVVRVTPNEEEVRVYKAPQLHFSEPQAYHDIYNNRNRWDKEETLYHSFGEDRSSFGFLTYKEAKERKDVLNKSFSARAVEQASDLVEEKVDELCRVFAKLAATSSLADLSWAFRCMAADIITYYCFGKSIDALHAPGFAAPFIIALDESAQTVLVFKHSSTFKKMILGCPPALTRIMSPALNGLLDLQEMLSKQIAGLTENAEQGLKLLPHSTTVFHPLFDRNNFKDGKIPEPGSIYEEAQALMFAGTDTTANALLVGTVAVARDAAVCQRLKAELSEYLPNPDQSARTVNLEGLPYLNACLKEALRLSSGVISGLPRVVPTGQDVNIAGNDVPSGTVVSIGSTFVHYNSNIFPDPEAFKPERWLESKELDNWLVAFSRGPRMCLGRNLAWKELQLAFATIWRRFDIGLDNKSPDKLVFRDVFLPTFTNPHVMARLKVAST